MSDRGLFETLLGNPLVAIIVFGFLLLGVVAVVAGIRQAFRGLRTRMTWTPLMKAIVERRADDASKLISADAVNTQTALGDTALIFAAQWGNNAIAKELLRHGADPNAEGDCGNTALIHAAERGNSELVEMLLDSGASIDGRNKLGSNALSHAVISGKVDLVEMMISRGAEITGEALLTAFSHNHTDIVRLLVDHGADINVNANTTAPTPLHLAVQSKNAELVEFLVGRGADVRAEYHVARERLTPLMIARQERDLRIISLLKSAGAQR